MSAGGRHEEQRKLVDIHHWNASRPDLFETSQHIEVSAALGLPDHALRGGVRLPVGVGGAGARVRPRAVAQTGARV